MSSRKSVFIALVDTENGKLSILIAVLIKLGCLRVADRYGLFFQGRVNHWRAHRQTNGLLRSACFPGTHKRLPIA